MEIKANNISWHEGHVNRKSRENLLKQRGCTIWMTGLSASGKSTLAFTLEHALIQRNTLAYVLDGDNIRYGLNKNLGFTADDREENIRRIGEVAKLFTDAGVIAMTAFISPYRADRNKARELVESGRFVEIYCQCSLDECENRDPKGLYKKARAGEIKQFTGIDAPYEAPGNPELIVETDKNSLEDSANQVTDYLSEHHII